MKYPNYLILSLFLCLMMGTKTYGQQNLSNLSLGGFRYGSENSPTGKEWESPQDLSLNKEVPHAYFFSFSTIDKARKVLPTSSDFYQSLDGTWKFNWVKTPDERPKSFQNPSFDVSKWDDVSVPMSWNILGIQKNGSLKYGVPVYVNQKVIFQHSVKVDDWKGGVMRTPPVDWTTYIDRNEVGSFRRSFDVPANWDGRDVYINFDGVDSFFYLWINGKYVGFSKNSRNLAAFNISKYLNKNRKNEIAVEVYRNSDGSFLEAQDMFRLPGIFRSVYLTSKPKISIRNIIAIPDLDASYNNGSLNINTEILNTSGKQAKGYNVSYSLFENKLFSDENSPVESVSKSGVLNVNPNSAFTSIANLSIKAPKKWSAEAPYMYTLVAILKDDKGKAVETISTLVGFRKVEIKNTKAADDEFGLAGRYYYVNGKTVKLKGVNRHETNPSTGKVVSHTQMLEEINLMKRANINHVRTSHYSNDPYWYYLCDKYGIYLEDEANIESHQYYYGEASLSHPVEWKDAHVARNLEMVYANINHPSIVIWSLGNEAGPGKNFVAAYDAIKKVDLSRPVQYERNNAIVDMGSNQYPSIGWVRNAVKGIPDLKYPFHISEYAHSMGNAAGNLIDYWDAIESTNFFMGGAIWDWIDQAMYSYDKTTGEKYLAYGGDFGDKPNDGMFVMNGLIFADLTPKPQYYEVKKVYQNVGVKWADSANRKIEIFNKNYFASLANYDVKWSLYENGEVVQNSTGLVNTPKPLAARERFTTVLPFDTKSLNPQSEYFVKIQFLLKEDMPWAKKGYSQMEEQLKVKSAGNRPSIASVAKGDKTNLIVSGDLSVIKGKSYEAKFDNKTGSLYSLKYGENVIIRDGEGPKLDALRAPVDNDNWAYQQWFQNGLHNLKHKVTSSTTYTKPDGTIVLSFTVESQAPNGANISGGSSGHYIITERKNPFGFDDFKFTTNQIWSIYKDGSIELAASISSNNPKLVLPQIGYKMELPSDYSNYSYYGRGPINNYADRKTAQPIELHTTKVANMFEPWPKPQSTGNREEVRWCSLTNNNGNGVAFIAKNDFATSALPWDELQLTLAPHPYQLPKSSGTHLYLNAAVTGLGGNSCGQGPPLERDRVKATTYSLGFIIRPINNSNFTNVVNVSTAGDAPIAVTQNQQGVVTISSENTDAKVYYTVGIGKAKVYNEPFLLKEGGVVTAWYADNNKLKFNNSFSKMNTIPLSVVFASSEETGEGSAKNFIDGDPSTYWHTMYSVTVAQYPHFIDFDAGEVKTITGFKYTPRQDGANGNIKGYKLQVSLDGKTWSENVATGNFQRNSETQVVKLSAPVKAKFVRFTAVSSQNGQDFASGAEFSLLSN